MRRTALFPALCCALLLPACGGDGDETPIPPTQAGPAPRAEKPKPREPRGELTRAEYVSLRRALDTLERLDGVEDQRRVHRGVARACRQLRRPRTSVVVANRRECELTVELIREIRNGLRRLPKCQAAGAQGDTSCFGGTAHGIGRAAHLTASAAKRTCILVHRRGLKGNCAKALVTSRRNIRALTELERAVRSVGQALDAKDVTRFRTAQTRVSAVDFESEDLSKLVRRCKRA